ncbi:NAD(P)H-hydrate dehydratase [Peptostreptococcus faecalis]|uniref:NAD(P)H-hydrate dehydratase n=1 Tax=Peptostreptococcus faecalis TaxID=2045015 RepID=UPI000C7A6990|nr:NAD(P)H-hydrate dehydratase [Peptostreptococcus faecalis]
MFIGGGDITSKLDKACIEKYMIPEILLMENAANAAVNRIDKIRKKIKLPICTITIFCAPGNNGGDGFAISRKLDNLGYTTNVILVGDESRLTSSSNINLDIVKSIGISYKNISSGNYENNKDDINGHLKNSDLVIDCLFGTGLSRNIEGVYKHIIENINKKKEKYSYRVISIDVPSGLDATTGEVRGVAIEANYTISFEYYKKGFLIYENKKNTGEIFVEKIGVPYKLYNEFGYLPKFIEEKFILDNLIIRDSYANKGDNGKVCVFAGSTGFYGAAYLCSKSAVKSGAGLVTLVCDKDVQIALSSKLTEEMTCSYEERERIATLLEKATAISFGPGLGNTEKTREKLKYVLNNVDSPVVIDADGINVFDPSFLNENSRCIITPHMGEFSRITGVEIKELQNDRIGYSQKYALENNLIVVLKGENTIVTDGIRTVVNTTGNSAMANGGMGDVLTGMITSFIAQGYDLFIAACLGVYLHGLCGDEVFKEKQVVNASDIIKIIQKTLKMLYNKIK